MDSKNAPVRAQSGGTKVSRRTVARGVAWSAPIAAVGVAAPAFAASKCTPEVTLSPLSCKCPGRSDVENEFVYYLKFCVTSENACGHPVGTKFKITKVVSNSNSNLVPDAPPNCGFAGLGAEGTVGTGGCTPYVRLRGEDKRNSAHFLDITWNFEGEPEGSQLTRVPTVTRDCGALSTDPNCASCG
jgi:hypothetical protein